MRADCTYYLTEAAQRAAILATNEPVTRLQHMTVDVNAAEALEFCRVETNGTLFIDTDRSPNDGYLHAAGWTVEHYGRSMANRLNPDVMADLMRGRAIARAREAEDEQTRVDNGVHNQHVTEAAYQRFLEDPAARLGEVRDALRGELKSPAAWWPEEHEAFVTEVRRRQQVDHDARHRAAAEKDLAKAAYLSDWVHHHTDELTRQQFDDGLLSRAEVLSLMAASVLDPIEAEYEPTICQDTNCACGRQELDTLPRAIYSVVRAMRARLPEGARLDAFERVNECLGEEDGSAGPSVYAARLTVTLGPFQFKRLIKLSDPKGGPL